MLTTERPRVLQEAQVYLILPGIAGIGITIWGIWLARRQLQQSNDIGLAQISNEQNWSLYDHYEDLPPSHPAKKQYTKQKYMWRVLHLNHLNLLEVAYEGEARGAMNDEKIKQWVQKSKEWFKNLEIPLADKFMEHGVDDGRKILQEIMDANEEYSPKFREWLKKEGIISP